MTQKHTPGPWSAHHEPTLNRSIVRAGFAGETNICVTYGAGLKSYEKQANVNLIAAAPDLLEALKNIVASSDANDDGSLANAILEARATIAKAEAA